MTESSGWDRLEYIVSKIRNVPDFPKKGILFKDITPLLGDPRALHATIDELAERWMGREVDVVAGIESRGFLFGVPLAMRLNVPFVPIRKPGKLPADTVKESYALEYGTAEIEVHRDAFDRGAKVLIVDDLLATGGTATAAGRLVDRLGGKLAGYAFVVELTFLDGRNALGVPGDQVVSLVRFGAGE